MAKPTARIGLLQAGLLLGALGVVLRAGQLQLVEGADWRAKADLTRKERVVLPASRGGIYDRNGDALAVTQEYFEVGVAPNELRGPTQDARTIAKALDLPLARVQRDLARRKWVSYPGPYNGLDVQDLRPLRGVYLYPEHQRHYPAGPLARAVIGSLTPDSGRGASGLELALDAALTGTPGEAVVLKDTRGRRFVSPSRMEREPVPGRDVYLTIDAELQEIAERALEEAVAEYEARGGDVVILDPHTGELLALASRWRGGDRTVVNRASFFTDPFEPGSTAKLFTAGALLALGKVDSTDAVFAENGVWTFPVNSRGDTRQIHDAHKITGSVTLAEAIKYSSNIGMGKFAERLTPAQQFDALRAFGFGSPSGVEFPSEARGFLRMPHQWDAYGKASVAMGYAFNVTSVQLAAAYGAIANDGILLTPTLVREVRDPDGTVLYQHRAEPVRRAIPPGVAATLRRYLQLVVGDGGSAESAQLANYPIAGKTGTAIRFDGGKYQDGHYTASFAAIWPAADPQLALVVKLDDPRGARYYGGTTAAPTTRAILEEALASRRSAIDRRRLAGPAAPAPATPDAPVDTAASPEAPHVAYALPFVPDTADRPGRRPVPNVAGASLRKAANTMLRRGFQVAVHGSGLVRRTTPAAGDSLGFGKTVTLWAE